MPRTWLRMTESNRRWWTLVGACFGLFLLMLDSTVAGLALPAIQRDFGASTAELQWVLNGYLLVLAVLVVTLGRLGDMYGRRRVFLVGVAMFTAGSVVAAVAPGPLVLICGRVLQGAGGAAMLTLSLAIVADAFPAEEQPRAFGIWAGVSALALGIGPLVGGALIGEASWRWIFWVNLPIAAAGAAITIHAARESRDEAAAHRLDWAGLVTLTIGLGSVVLALVQGKGWGWGSPITVGLFAAGLIGLGLFWRVERRVANPIVEFPLFRSGPYLGATAAAFAVMAGYWALMFFEPQYLQNILGHSAVEAGVLLLPVTAPMFVISPFAGRLIARFGSRSLMTIGMAVGAVGLMLLTRVDATSGYGRVLPGLLAFGICIGLVYAPMSTAAMTALPRAKAGIASGVLAMTRVTAGALSLAVTGALFQDWQRDRLDAALSAGGAGLRAQRGELDGLVAGSEAARGALAGLPPGVASEVERVARESFTYGLARATWVLVAIAAVGAVLTWALVRSGREGGEPRHRLRHFRL